jgi:hypothetical protein
MKRLLVVVVGLAFCGCGVSSSELEEELAKARAEWEAYAKQQAEAASSDVNSKLTKRVVDIESNFVTRTVMDEKVNQSRARTLEDVDKKLEVQMAQLEEVKKKVDVVNMANKEEVLRVLSELQGITVTLVQTLKTQKDAFEQAIKQLEAIQVPEPPKEPK